MSKVKLNLRKVAMIVVCLAVTAIFAACDENKPNDDDNGGISGKENPALKEWVGTWGYFTTGSWPSSMGGIYSHSSGGYNYYTVGTSTYVGQARLSTFLKDGSYKELMIMKMSSSWSSLDVLYEFKGNYSVSNGKLHINITNRNRSGDGGKTFDGWDGFWSKQQFNYSFKKDSNGDYVELTCQSYENSQGSKECFLTDALKFYKEK